MGDEIRFPAKYMVFWPGQEVMACEKHAQGLQNVNRIMGGAPLSMRELETLGERGECSNCVNEAAK